MGNYLLHLPPLQVFFQAKQKHISVFLILYLTSHLLISDLFKIESNLNYYYLYIFSSTDQKQKKQLNSQINLIFEIQIFMRDFYLKFYFIFILSLLPAFYSRILLFCRKSELLFLSIYYFLGCRARLPRTMIPFLP